mgnify:CR=1 FL=1
MGSGRLGTLGKSPRFDNNDGFTHCKSTCRTHKLLCVADPFHVEQDASRVRILAEKIDEVTEIHIAHGAERGKHAESDMLGNCPVKYCTTQRTTLGYESDVSGWGAGSHECCIQAGIRPHKAQAIRPKNAHAVFLPRGHYSLLQQSPFLADLFKASRDNDQSADTRPAAGFGGVLPPKQPCVIKPGAVQNNHQFQIVDFRGILGKLAQT